MPSLMYTRCGLLCTLIYTYIYVCIQSMHHKTAKHNTLWTCLCHRHARSLANAAVPDLLHCKERLLAELIFLLSALTVTKSAPAATGYIPAWLSCSSVYLSVDTSTEPSLSWCIGLLRVWWTRQISQCAWKPARHGCNCCAQHFATNHCAHVQLPAKTAARILRKCTHLCQITTAQHAGKQNAC